MNSAKFLIAGGTVNWTEGLEKYYAEDERKRKEHGERLAQRDAAQLKADAAASPIGALKDLATLSTSVAKLLKQQKAAKEREEEALKLAAGADWSRLSKSDQDKAIAIAKSNADGIKGLKIDYHTFGRLLEESDITPQGKAQLRTSHGGYMAMLHQRMGMSTLEGLPTALRAREKAGKAYSWDGTEFNSFQEAYDFAKGNGSQEAFIKSFAYGELATLGFNEEFVTNNFYKPLNKWLSTKGVMAKLGSRQTYLNDRELESSAYLKVAAKLAREYPDDHSLAGDVQLQLKDANFDKPLILNRVKRLIHAKELHAKDILNMKKGFLYEKGVAGDTGESLFSDEQWSEIDQALLARAVQTNNEREAGLEIEATQLKASAQDLTQEQWDLRVANLKVRGYDTSDLEDWSIAEQGEGRIKEIMTEFAPIIASGEIDSATNVTAVKNMKNTTAQSHLSGMQEDYIRVQEINKISNHKDRRDSIGNRMTTIHKKTSMREAGPLFGISSSMADEIAGEENRIMFGLYTANPETTTLKTDTEIALTKILKDRGFFEKPNSPNAGIYTPEVNGEHKRYRDAVLARSLNIPNYNMVEARRTSTLTEVAKWDQGFTSHKIHSFNNKADGQTLQDAMINSLGLLEPDDIVAPVQFLNLNKKGRLIGTDQRFRATPKLEYLRRKFPRTTKLQMWAAQTRALINSDNPEHQELVRITNLEAKLKAVERVSSLEESAKEFLERSGAKDAKSLLYYFYAGVDRWSPNVRSRIEPIYRNLINSQKGFTSDNEMKALVKSPQGKPGMSSFSVDSTVQQPSINDYWTDDDDEKELDKQLTNN